MNAPKASPAPGPFVYLRLVDSWDGPMPLFKTFLLSNEQALQFADDIRKAVGDEEREPRTPFHGKPNEPIEYPAHEVPKV